jgi:hypothetical protein
MKTPWVGSPLSGGGWLSSSAVPINCSRDYKDVTVGRQHGVLKHDRNKSRTGQRVLRYLHLEGHISGCV